MEYDDRMVTAAELGRLEARGWTLVTIFGPATMEPGTKFRVLLRRSGPEARETAADRLARARAESALAATSEPQAPKRGPGRPRKVTA